MNGSTAWRWFPHSLILAMAAVFVVNGGFVYVALRNFPGEAGKDGFDLSNNYDHVLELAARQAALGWRVDVSLDGLRRPVLLLADRAGAPVTARIDAVAERPVGPPESTKLTFEAVSPGTYRAETNLFSGQWDILLTVRSADASYTATRRLVAR